MSCCWPPCFSAWVAGIYNPCVTLSELKPPLRHWDEIWTNPWDIIPCKYDPAPAQIQPRVNPGRRVDNKHIFKALFEREGLVTYFGDNARTSKHTWLVALPHRLLLCFEFFPTQAFLAEKKRRKGRKYTNKTNEIVNSTLFVVLKSRHNPLWKRNRYSVTDNLKWKQDQTNKSGWIVILADPSVYLHNYH